MSVKVSIMRNMIHYKDSDDPNLNFYDYFENEDKSQLIRTMDQIIFAYLHPLENYIREYIDIENMRSMTDWEMIKKRTIQMFKRK